MAPLPPCFQHPKARGCCATLQRQQAEERPGQASILPIAPSTCYPRSPELWWKPRQLHLSQVLPGHLKTPPVLAGHSLAASRASPVEEGRGIKAFPCSVCQATGHTCLQTDPKACLYSHISSLPFPDAFLTHLLVHFARLSK